MKNISRLSLISSVFFLLVTTNESNASTQLQPDTAQVNFKQRYLMNNAVNSIEEDSLSIAMGAFNFKPVNQDVITLVAFTFLLLKDKDSFKIKVHHSSPITT